MLRVGGDLSVRFIIGKRKADKGERDREIERRGEREGDRRGEREER